jgi:peroxiredoxin
MDDWQIRLELIHIDGPESWKLKMGRISKRFATVAFFAAAVTVPMCPAAAQRIDATGNTNAAAELRELGHEYERVEEEWLRAIPPDGAEESNSEVSDEQWLREGREAETRNPSPDVQLLHRFLAFAKNHPDSPSALDALAFVIRRGGSQTGDVQGLPWRTKEQAIDEISEHHMNDPRVVHVFDMLCGSLPSQKTMAFLRRALETDSDRTTRAAAGLSLARHLHHFAQAHERSSHVKGKARLQNHDRFWKLVVIPYLEEEFPYDRAEVSAEIERLLAHVVDEYSDDSATEWKLSGPSKVFLHTDADAQPKTYGEQAESLLFELNHLVPGKQAPDIEGLDAQGKRFRLSDYRGKVVLLTFSANWCGGCVELYPLQRNLVDKFYDDPFVLLSVSRDESIDTLKTSMASRDITWRCWWDGMQGPIYEAWNSPGAPKIYLLDQDGMIQDERLNRFTPQADFERAIARLLNGSPAE